MSDTGIVRNLDELGRIVIPIEIRRRLAIGPRDPIAISLQRGAIVLRKAENLGCVFCGSADSLLDHHGRAVCDAGRSELAAA